jgi:hypothetical protein
MERRPPSQSYSVSLLTRLAQVTGRLEVVGAPLLFLSDPIRDSLVIHDAQAGALTANAPFRSLSRPLLTVRRREIVFLYFPEPEAQAALRAQLMARSEQVIAYTALAILKGGFHLPAETVVTDFLAVITNTLLPVSGAQLFLPTPPPAPFPNHCDLLLVGREHIQMYHPA